MLSWLKAMGSKQAHICMEATGRHSLGVALALHDAGHVVSVVNPAQIRDFARTKLGRNKTDKVDAALIREYAELFSLIRSRGRRRRLRCGGCANCKPCVPASSPTGRSGRIASVAVLATASPPRWRPQRLSISPANSRRSTGPLRETIDQDVELRGRRDLLLSVIGVGETLAASLLAEMPEPTVLRRSGEIVAYAGLNPSHHRSGTSIDRPTRISKIGNATLRSSCRRYRPCASTPRSRLSWLASKALVASSPSRSWWRRCASSWCSVLAC